MRLTLIALLLAGVVGCDSEPVSEFDAARQAAEQGDAGAQTALGVMYEDGEGVPQDYAEAVKWFRKAAEQGDADAQFRLGYKYYHGKGVPEDYTEAAKWYRKAAEQGHVEAQYELRFAYDLGDEAAK